MMFLKILIFHSLTLVAWARRPASFRVGSVFLERDLLIHETFGEIFEELNGQEDYLNGTRVDYDIQYTDLDQFDAYQKACMEMTFRVVAVFGSSPTEVDSSVAAVCSALQVPYLTTHPVLTSADNRVSRRYAIHLGPSQNDLISAVKEAIGQLKWSQVALLSHRETGSLDAHKVMEILQNQGVKVNLLDLKRGDIRPGLAKLRNKGIQHFIVDIGQEYLKLFFEEAMKAGIVHEKSAFLSASLDLATVDMEDLRHTGSSIMGFTILNAKNYREAKSSGELSQDLSELVFRSHKAALLYDGVHLFSRAVEKLISDTDLTTPQVSCDNKDSPYLLGEPLLKEINSVVHDGLTGRISIKNGLRDSVNLAIIRLDTSGQFSQVGNWSRDGLATAISVVVKEENSVLLENSSTAIRVKTRVTTNNGYMRRVAPNAMALQSGPDQYEGLLKDLLELLAADLEFDYFLEEDFIHGFPTADGNWTGIIGSLVDREAQMAVDDLTITSQRSQVVDFSVPYQTSTLQILIKKSELKSRGMGIQSFFDPFSGHLWVCILVAYVMVSIFMFVIGRVTPYERHAPQDGKGNTLTLANSFWFTLSAFFFRSTTISPKSFSTRFLSAFWWLFCLVIVFIYVISLKSLIFPHEENSQSHFITIEELLKEEDFKFIVYPQGATHYLLQNSKDEMHQKIWSRTDMQLSADQISSDEDLESAAANLQTNQGFVIESVQAEAILKHQCHLTVAKGNLGSRHYALAFPKGSALTDKVSKLILEYSENGILFTLKQKWNQPQNCSHSESIQDINSSRALPFYGPFMLLLFAGVTALALAFIELLVYACLRSKRASFCLPSSGPTGARGGKACAILKEELSSVISRAPEAARRRSRIETANTPGMTSPRLNRFRQNGDVLRTATATNGNGIKNGHATTYYQTQALLRQDANEDNAQL